MDKVREKRLGLDPIAIGRRIAEARVKRRWTQKLLGELCGESEMTCWKWENGQEIPPLEICVLLCMHLQRSLDHLVLGCARNGRAWRMARKYFELYDDVRIHREKQLLKAASEPATDAGRITNVSP